eukprot:12319347-Prorocentrum_lima.AAC.1
MCVWRDPHGGNTGGAEGAIGGVHAARSEEPAHRSLFHGPCTAMQWGRRMSCTRGHRGTAAETRGTTRTLSFPPSSLYCWPNHAPC